jgi:hypothetical protein
LALHNFKKARLAGLPMEVNENVSAIGDEKSAPSGKPAAHNSP